MEKELRCDECGRRVPRGAAMCPECGGGSFRERNVRRSESQAELDRTTVIILIAIASMFVVPLLYFFIIASILRTPVGR